ncbi:MAG: hypothetical protein Q9208_004536 [Pyrenodesmia sp. 3 TL-2023]
MDKDAGFIAAVEEAKVGLQEGGIPIGACLVSKAGKILGKGHNMRVQKGSATLHAEISALEDTGRLQAAAYQGATMMCTGACVMYKVGRVVIGENKSFLGGEEYLKQRGIEVVVLDNKEMTGMMQKYIDENPEVWYASPIVITNPVSVQR